MKRPGPLKAVVFDLDGTLLDSLTLVLAAVTHALEPFGGRPTMDIFARLGGPPDRFMAELVTDPGDVPVALERMASFHRENVHLIRPYAGARELLLHLQARRIQAALWTGRDRASAEFLLREHGLGAFFAAVVCGDDLPTHKPDPAGLREILARLGAGPDETLFVGDADVDVLGGVACGVDTLLIRHARTIRPEVLALAGASVATPAEAYAAVRGGDGGPP